MPKYWLLVLVLAGCSDGSGPSELAPGTTEYTAVRLGQPTYSLTFKGTATFDSRALPNAVQLELAADSPGQPNYQMLLYHYGSTPIVEGKRYHITGDQATVDPDTVFYVHGSHVIRGDARTSGTLTITHLSARKIVADFDYIGPADSAGVQWSVEVKGKLNAECSGGC